MDLKELKTRTMLAILEFPELREQLTDNYAMAHEEVMDGSSEYNECELALGTLKEIVEEKS